MFSMSQNKNNKMSVGRTSPPRTLRDLMESAVAKSIRLSSPMSKTGLMHTTLQNRMVKVINSAILTNPLNIEVVALDKLFIDAAFRTTTVAAVPSCMSEALPTVFSVIGDEPNTKVSCMDFSSETDREPQPGDSDYVLQRCPGEIYGEDETKYTNEEADNVYYEEREEGEDNAVFERLMMEYDYDGRLYQNYNNHGYSSCTASTGLLLVAQSGATAFSLNSRPPRVGLEMSVDGNIHTLCENVSEEDEDSQAYDDMQDFYEQYYFD